MSTVDLLSEQTARAYGIGDPGRQIKCFLALCRHAGIQTAEVAVLREQKQGSKATTETKPKRAGATNPRRSLVSPTERRGGSASLKPPPVAVALNVEIPADWTEEQIRDRVVVVTRALERATDA